MTRVTSPTAVIEEDASNAFSYYRPGSPMFSPSEKFATCNYSKQSRGRREKREKRDGRPASSQSQRRKNVQLDDFENVPINKRHHNDESSDRINSILHADDSILKDYLPQFAFLHDNYYSKVKPFRSGRRNLPPNQIEVVLRRKAIKKGENAPKGEKPVVEGAGKWNVARIQRSFESTRTSREATIGNSHNTAVDTFHIPEEEIMGDTSLGLKLTILQGKVIIQHISALDDGSASPAQVCGLLSPGDVMIAVNGKSLVHGTIHNPVTMDKIISALKPLSQPINEQTKEYSREVRLRFALGDGISLLREQDERERKKLERMQLRKRLGLDGDNMMVSDPVADLFGVGALMAVDQHSGMPMFGILLDRSNEENRKEENKSSDDVTDENDSMTKNNHAKRDIQPVPLLAKTRRTLLGQIAYQVQLDIHFTRTQNASEFFTLDRTTSSLLRPPSPLPVKMIDLYGQNPIDAHKRRLEVGTQAMSNAKSLFSSIELQDHEFEVFEDVGEPPKAPFTSTTDHPNFRQGSICSGESAEVEHDHRLLVELAANNENWKMNIMKCLRASVVDIEKEKLGHYSGSSRDSRIAKEEAPISGLDEFLFGDVACFLGKKKQSFALPPAEITSILFDLVKMLESDLPYQLLMKDESSPVTTQPLGCEKVVTFAKDDIAKNSDKKKATDFLLNFALGEWLKSFRPLPWKHRRALWSYHYSGLDGESMVSSRMDDDDSLSLMSGFTSQTRSIEKDTRTFRELIEDLTLNHETRVETLLNSSALFSNSQTSHSSRLTEEAEDQAAALIDAYGSYLDIYKCLVCAGKVYSKVIIDKLMCLANHDSQHKVAVKAMQKEKNVIFYKPTMLSAILEILRSMSIDQYSGFMTLLVSAYPDLQPWCVREASGSSPSGDFYAKYLSSLLHHEYGNDAAKQDKALVKEWCSILCSLEEGDPSLSDDHRRSFLHVATCNNQISYHYCRDLPFLMDCCMKISEFGLAISLAHEITTNPRYCHDELVLGDVLQHLQIISVKAIEGNRGEVNRSLLGQLIGIYNALFRCAEENNYPFDFVAELSKLIEKCYANHQNNLNFSSSNIGACIIVISETAPPTYSLRVLSDWDHSSVGCSNFVAAIHTSLIRGAREGVRSGLSGSLLRIQRAREEGRRPSVENDIMRWKADTDKSVGFEEESGGVIWSSILDGSASIAK
ncbi:hypothetical protein ACHAXA_009355 [Cyclostephanos tholiformis]|uniref:PDZ domain-containing protein n=1 Tax=Cyclostephanos tholiformis TaxID=382380 RepID=A0ABD3SQ62_9STRA